MKRSSSAMQDSELWWWLWFSRQPWPQAFSPSQAEDLSAAIVRVTVGTFRRDQEVLNKLLDCVVQILQVDGKRKDTGFDMSIYLCALLEVCYGQVPWPLHTLSVPSYEMVMALLCVGVVEKIITLQRRQQGFPQHKAQSWAGLGPGPQAAQSRALVPDGGPARQHAGDSQALFLVGSSL